MRLTAFFYGMGYLTLSGDMRNTFFIMEKYDLTSSEQKINLWLKWANLGSVLTFIVVMLCMIFITFLVVNFGNIFLLLVIIPGIFLALACYSQLKDWS